MMQVGTTQQREMALRIARGIWKRVPPHVPLEDLEQVALTELWEALQRKGSNADPPYLVVCIRGRVKDALRAHDWLPRRHRQSDRGLHVIHSADIAERFEENLRSPTPSPEEAINAKQLLAQITKAPLPERERHVLRLHYDRGYRFKDIAAELGVSEPRISQLHHRAIRMVRAWLAADSVEESPDTSPCHIPVSTREVIMEKHAAHSDGHSPDPAPGGAPPEPRPADTFLGRVRAGRLGMATAREPDRPVPGGGGTAEPRAAEPPELRSAAAAEAAPPDEAVAEPTPDAAELDAVPSVLPEGGLDLRAELVRYRDWIIEQALLRTLGKQRDAAKLLCLDKSILCRILRRGGVLEGMPRYRRAKTAAAPPASVSASAPSPEKPRRRAEHGDSLSEVISRLPRDEVAEWHGQGKSTGWIARQLTNRLGVNQSLVDMAVRRTVASMARHDQQSGGV